MKTLLMAVLLTFMLALTPPAFSGVVRPQLAHVVFLLPEEDPRILRRRRRNHYVNRWAPC